MSRIVPPSPSDGDRKRFYDSVELSRRTMTRSGAVAPPAPRFDGAAAWARLEPEAQAAIGAAALELAVARQGLDCARDMAEECRFEDAEQAAGKHLEERAVEHLLDVGAIPRDQVPPVPSLAPERVS